MFARRTGAEIGPGDQYRTLVERAQIQHKRRIVTPRREQSVLETCSGHPLQVDRGDDLIRVDIGPAQRNTDARMRAKRFHGWSPFYVFKSAGDDNVPRTAVAAATAGDTRCVRPPLPCLPSKFRFEVAAQRCPGDSWSGFMPRHIEQPAWRHSAPAAVKTSPRPSDSACARTRIEPGTTSMRTPSATLRPRSTSATTRRSSILPLVHDPTNTASTAMSRIAVPGRRSMYANAFAADWRAASSNIS